MQHFETMVEIIVSWDSQRVQVPSKQVLRPLFTPKSQPQEVPRDPLGFGGESSLVSERWCEMDFATITGTSAGSKAVVDLELALQAAVRRYAGGSLKKEDSKAKASAVRYMVTFSGVLLSSR